MRLVIRIDGVDFEFVEGRADGEYPWLGKVGNLLLAARAGHLESVGLPETASITVQLDNENRQAATLLGRPVRAGATLFDDEDETLFSGLIQKIEYGPTLAITIES